MPGAVLDASALLAYLRDEPGADVVEEAIADGAVLASVNLAEVLSRIADRGGDPAETMRDLIQDGLLDGAIQVEPFGGEDAVEVARLRPMTGAQGLSLGDRACLAVGRRLNLPVLTADASWSELDVALEVRQIR